MIPFIVSFRRLGRALLLSMKNPEFRALFSVFVFLLVIGTFFYMRVERWSVVDAFYFSVVTLSTAGFGDLAPQTVPGKLFTTVYLLLGVGVFVSIVATLANATINNLEETKRRRRHRNDIES